MGRSVNYLSNALGITYINLDIPDTAYCDNCGNSNTEKIEELENGHNHTCSDCKKTFEGYPPDAGIEWEFFTESIEELLKRRIPSIDILTGKDARWDNRETKIFAENRLVEFGISEYCGLVSISVRPIQDDYSWRIEGLAKRWIEKTWPGIQKDIVESFPTSALKKIATFSNGEGIYELAKQTA